jgi:hypothetical protein
LENVPYYGSRSCGGHNSKLEYTYLPNAFFVISHNSMALKFIYYGYKIIIADITLYPHSHVKYGKSAELASNLAC